MNKEKYKDLFLKEARINIKKLLVGLGNKNSLKTSMRVAHSLKSEAGTMGYASMEKCARKIEEIYLAEVAGEKILSPKVEKKLKASFLMLEKSLNSIDEKGQEVNLDRFPNIVY